MKRKATAHPPLILASASPRRVGLLRQLGRPFTVEISQINEVNHAELTAAENCEINAHQKARSISRRFPEAIVLGADTLVCLGVAIFGKPRSFTEARRMIEQLQGKTHVVVTAVCLLHARTSRSKVFSEHTAVTFRPLSPKQIRSYLQAIDPLDKAGAYAIQEHGDQIIAAVNGSLSNVIGLPLERLRAELGAW